MEQYKKQSRLHPLQIDLFRDAQIEIIMDRIQTTPFKPWQLKKIHVATFAMSIVFVIALFIINLTPIQPSISITYQDIYHKLVTIDQRMNLIIDSLDVPEEETTTSNIVFLGYNPDYYISKDALYALYTDNSWKIEYGIHFEYLVNVRISLNGVVGIMDQITSAPLNEWVDTGLDEGIESFKIAYDPEGYIVLALRTNQSGSTRAEVFRIGYNEELLDIDHIIYEDDWTDVDADSEYYRFIFKENQSSTSIIFQDNTVSFRYIDFITEEQYFLLRTIDSNTPSDTVYGDCMFTHYDPQRMLYSSIEYSDTEILSEYYVQYDEYGKLFSYSDNDTTNDELYLTFNLLYATGWNYASYNPNNETERGIYVDGFKILKDESIDVYKLGRTVSVELRSTITTSDLTDSMLNLSNLNLYFNEGNTTLDYMNTLYIRDFNTIFDIVQYEDVDFSSNTMKNELFLLIDDSMYEILRDGE